jgi:hypothetical protein
VGYSYDIDYAVATWRIEKRNAATGALDTGFGTDGIITYSIDSLMSTWHEAWTIAFDSTYLYIGGGEYGGDYDQNYYARIEKRLKTDGSLVTTFDTNGYLVYDSVTTYANIVKSIAINSEYIYTGGFAYGASDYERKLDRIGISTGVVSTGWSPGFTDSGNDEFLSIALDSNSNIFLGGYVTDGSSCKQWQLEKRNIDTGSLDTDFGSGGVVQSNFVTTTRNKINSIAVDSEYLYSAGYEDVDGESITRWRLEKRNIDTGDFDENFSSNGEFTVNLADGDDAINDIAVDQDFIYIVGSDYSPANGTQWRIIKMVKYNGAY